MVIRKATINDVNKILLLLQDTLFIHSSGRPDIFKEKGSKYNRAQLEQIISCEQTPIFVADDNGVMGYAFCQIKEQKESGALKAIKSLYIDDLCVDKGARGSGIGKKLYEHALAFAKQIGCYHLTLNVWELNQSAKTFYEKLGLMPLKTTMEKIIN